MSPRQSKSKGRGGFTILELLVVIGIIAFLISISAVMYANFVDRAREAATAATIKKTNGLLQQRLNAFRRHIDKEFDKDRRQPVRNAAVQQKMVQLQPLTPGISPQAALVLVIKDRFRNAFPQQVADLVVPDRDRYGIDGQPGKAGVDDDGSNGTDDPGELDWPDTDDPDAAGTHANTELLYLMLVHFQQYGATPVDEDAFSTSEVRDTDGDGAPEIVDSWGNPLRFYRWPTRAIKPDGVNINRDLAMLLFIGLPNPPTGGQRDPLDEDSDDVIGYLTTGSSVDLSSEVNAATYHDLDTRHKPLLVSAGPDGELGLFEPNHLDTAAGEYGTLAQPYDLSLDGSLNDNITNHNQRAGGN